MNRSRTPDAPRRHPLRARRAHLAGLGGAAALAVAAAYDPWAAAADGLGADPAAINDWNATTVAVVLVDAGKPNPEAPIWLAFAHAAMYNAVVGITGRYALYKWAERGPATASPEAAAAAAANRMLLTYFGHVPAARARVGDAYAAALGRVPGGAAKEQGVAYGERAADRILALREGDGRAAALPFTAAPAPGVWRPTPPANAPFLAPWLSRLRPLTLTADGDITNWAAYNAQPGAWGAARNPDGTLTSDPTGTDWIERFRAPAPPALGSATYAAEFDEVKALGPKTSPARTSAQTETALFISGLAVAAMQASVRDLAARRGLDISDRARLFAAVTMSAADAIIVCWDCKYHYGLWRPITAIRLAAQDGNPATEADPAWEPLLNTPPYPDYSSGANSGMGSVTRAMTRVLDTSRLSLYLTSPATNTTRHYESADALCQDTVDARVWSGLHFRTADVVALAAGRKVADWVLDHYLQPLRT